MKARLLFCRPGRGDHRHVGQRVEPYVFTTTERLVADFLEDARR